MKPALERLARWYKDGLIDPEMGARDRTGELINANQAGIFFGPWWAIGYGNGDSFKNNPNADWQAYPVYADNGKWNVSQKAPSTTALMISRRASPDTAAAVIITYNSFWISVQRTVLGTVITLLVLILMAYPLAKPKHDFKPRGVIMWIVIFCMLFNGGTIPWYITVKNYRLIDSIWGLVLSGSLPVFNLILMVNFFRSLPTDLEEAAVIDGAGPWKILFMVVVPCSVPVIATIVLFTGVYHWNEFFQGLVLTTSENHYPLQTYIRQLVVNIQASMSTLTREQLEEYLKLSNKSLNAAKVFIALIPMLVIYPFIQRYFISGIMLGAVKE